MLVNFVKMHGLGNDFVVIDQITQNLKLHTAHLKRIADRHLGIGCDQILILEPPIRPDAHFYLRIFNANGQEVEQCGNGIRCAARFFYDSGFARDNMLYADCISGPLECRIDSDEEVTIKLAIPQFDPKHIPFTANAEALHYPLSLEDQTVQIAAVSLGNPHAVIEVPDIDTALVKKWGSQISRHSRFPKGANVSFMQIIDKNNIRLRVYERGVGETLACGSGAVASAVSGIKNGTLDQKVKVQFSTGNLTVTWAGNKKAAFLSGPTTNVFVGRFRL